MLRLGFLPSDFNPMLLMLGEAEDFRALAGVLRRFAREAGGVALDELAFCAAWRTRVTLTAADAETVADGSFGLQQGDGTSHFAWRLDAARAAAFAELVETLAAPGRLAGSEMLECGTHDEIPVKVSRGEYTDDFLGLGAVGIGSRA
jgi:hypothetical protein